MVFPVVGGREEQGYNIDNSLRFNPGDNAYLNRTPGSEGNKRTYTLSFWAKICPDYGTDTSTNNFFTARNSGGYTSGIQQISGGHIQAFIYSDTGGEGYKLRLVTNAAFRDTSAWYHIVLAVDTTQGTAGDRANLYVNGSQITSFSTETYPDQNFDSHINDDVPHYMGNKDGSNDDYDGYLADFYLIDGAQYAASNFGETDDNGVWIPKKATGLSFGTNGFFMEFQQTGTSANSSGKGADTSGQDNHYDDNNMTAEDITTDTPTNNFATANPLASNASAFAEGNTKTTGDTGTSYSLGASSSIGFKSGKWYMEFKVSDVGNNTYIGLMKEGNDKSVNADYQYPLGNLFYRHDGDKLSGSGSGFGVDTTYGDTFTDNDIIGVAADMDNRNLYFYKNGTIQNSGTAAFTSSLISSTAGSSIEDDTYYFFFTAGYNDSILFHNYGQPSFSISSGNTDANGYGNFEYSVPSGYYALCTKNLAEYG